MAADRLRLDRRTRLRLRTTGAAAADYGLNVLILYGFAAAGTIPPDVPQKVLAAALVFNTLFLGAIATGYSLRFKDPSLTGIQVFAACAINVCALTLAPQIAYMFIVNLFVPLSFGSLHFGRRQFFSAWVVTSATLAALLWVLGDRLGIALSTPAERFLFWSVVTLAIGRFLAINAEVSRLRARLHEQNKELAEATAKLADLATHDELTGIWNRREFMKLLASERERAGRSGSGFSVGLVDADNFKEVNDRFGHLVGDAVLQKLAALLSSELRSPDRLGRYGGEEFSLLLMTSTAEGAATALERMRLAIEAYDWGSLAPGLRFAVSAGVAAWTPGEPATQVLHRADEALYAAKRAGRNRVIADLLAARSQD